MGYIFALFALVTLIILTRMVPKEPGIWESRCFCSKCSRHSGLAHFGQSFHNNEHNPVCPDCGAYKALVAKTCRWNNDVWEFKT